MNSQTTPPPPSNKLIAFGNALLDHSVVLADDELLVLHKLGANELAERDAEVIATIIKDVTERYTTIDRHPGGSAINTCRILRALGEKRTLFCSAIGQDECGQVLRQQLIDGGVQVFLQETPNQPTGICICLILKENRCCLANIGASQHFKSKFLLNDMETLTTQIVYIEGFFVTNRIKEIVILVDNLLNDQRILAANLSARYVVDENPEEIRYLVENSDIIFGNMGEFMRLAKLYNCDDCHELIKRLNFRRNKCHQKVLVVTNNKKSVNVFIRDSEGSVRSIVIDVDNIAMDEIIDTTGAGDSFVAGFFYAFLRDRMVEACVRYGVTVASKKIRSIGASLPEAVELALP